jgi:hypothetical protein
MIDRLILNNLRRTQTFDRNLRANAGVEKIAEEFAEAIMFQPHGAPRSKSIEDLKGALFAHAKDSAIPAGRMIGETNAGDVAAKLPPPSTPPVAKDLQRTLFDSKIRTDQRLKIVQSSIKENGDKLGERLTRYWLEPAEGGNEEKLARLREIHKRLEERRKNFESRYREFSEGKIKTRPSKPALDYMSDVTANVKQEIRVQARRTGTDAETRVFTEKGYKLFAWIAVNAGEACPDCQLRQSVILSLDEWERLGRPGSGETICVDHCFCMLVPAETLTVAPSLATAANLRANKGVLTTDEQRRIFDLNRKTPSRPTPPVVAAAEESAASVKSVETIPDVKPADLPVQPVNTADALWKQAEETKPVYDSFVDKGEGVQRDIGATSTGNFEDAVKEFGKPGAVVITAPIKGAARSAEKVASKFGGNYNRLADVVRGTIAVDTVADVSKVIASVERNAAAKGFKIVELDNKFAHPTEAGYRDLSMKIAAPNGHLTELQINTKPMMIAKGDGHKLYEEARTIDAKAKIEKRLLTPDEAARVKALNEKMTELYAKAWTDSQ